MGKELKLEIDLAVEEAAVAAGVEAVAIAA